MLIKVNNLKKIMHKITCPEIDFYLDLQVSQQEGQHLLTGFRPPNITSFQSEKDPNSSQIIPATISLKFI